jgi:hypothetical protein
MALGFLAALVGHKPRRRARQAPRLRQKSASPVTSSVWDRAYTAGAWDTAQNDSATALPMLAYAPARWDCSLEI